jgi:enediyne biosynthesis protein E4
MRFFVIPSLLVLISACASTAPDMGANVCPAPRLIASDLIVGDGSRDRGFPGGVSLADVDGDGDLDLMATGGYNPTASPTPPHYTWRANVLYLNDGAGNFTHSDDPEFTRADHPFSGSTWADIDNDGDLDAFIAVQHGRPDIFLRNLGAGRFAREDLGDATATRGSNFAESWVDIDNDGDYDLMSGGPTMEIAGPMLAYRNDDGAFTRVTGLPIENGRANPASILWADFDNDGDQDLIVTNSAAMRYSNLEPAEVEFPTYYRNDGAWNFARAEGQAFSDPAYSSTAAAVGDIDNDGDLDLHVGHYGYGSDNGRDRIFLNDGAGRFVLDTRFEGHVHATETTSAFLTDFDGDGDLDLLTTVFGEGPRLSVNDGSGAYSLVADQALLSRAGPYWGGASGDIDADGDLDAVVGAWGYEERSITILRNETSLCGSPLRIELRTSAGAPDPIGSRVTLITRGSQGERRQLRESMGQSTFRSQSGSAFLFSVPRGERVVAAEVRWPDGRVETLRRPRHGVVVRDDA